MRQKELAFVAVIFWSDVADCNLWAPKVAVLADLIISVLQQYLLIAFSQARGQIFIDKNNPSREKQTLRAMSENKTQLSSLLIVLATGVGYVQ